MINFYFIDDDNEFTEMGRYDVIWTNTHGKYRMSFNKASLKLAINNLLHNF